jgi:hypothetical protein
MAVKPDQDPEMQIETEPLPGEVERERADISVVSILAVMAIVVAAGLWFFTKDREMIAGGGTVVKQTTGSTAKEEPVSNPPTRPAPTPQASQRQQ